MDKEVLEIHEVSEELFDLPLEEYILTFDDGLHTQYQYINELAKIDTRKIFFISTSIVCDGEQSKDYIPCDAAHEYFFRTGNAKHYMTWDQIREISKLPNCEIGGHSHFHKDIGLFKSFTQKLSFVKKDTELMRDRFISELGYSPTPFCFPYNYTEYFYNCILQKNGFTNLYGSNRSGVNCLLKPVKK